MFKKCLKNLYVQNSINLISVSIFIFMVPGSNILSLPRWLSKDMPSGL